MIFQHQLDPLSSVHCHYYLKCLGVPGFEEGICSFGCRDEPGCVTGEYHTDEERDILFVAFVQRNLFVVGLAHEALA